MTVVVDTVVTGELPSSPGMRYRLELRVVSDQPYPRQQFNAQEMLLIAACCTDVVERMGREMQA
jgi:hypothetical protein